jgi:ABC-2 type transport system permease protein
MRVIWAFIKKDFLIQISYKAAFFFQLLGIFLGVPIFYFISQIVTGSESKFLARYGGNYFAFLLLGIAFVDYLGLSLRTFNQSIRDSQLMGTLEIVLLSPTAIPKLLIYSSLWGYLFTSTRFILYLLMGLIFGLDLGNANYPAALLTLILAIISFASFGIIIASLTMIIKRGEVFNALLSAASVFLGGVLFPTEVLPKWLETLSKFLPITHALEGMRMALIKGYSVAEIFPQILVLLLFSVIFFPIGILVFYGAVRWTKIIGTVEQY